MKKKSLYILAILLIIAICYVQHENHTANTEEVLYTANVDLDIAQEEVVRTIDNTSNEAVYEIRWADGKRIARTNEDAFAEYCVKAYNLDEDQALEIVTWFVHQGSTRPEISYAEPIVYDLQDNGDYKTLPLPRLDNDPDKPVGLDFQIVYQGKQHRLAFFEVYEPTIPYHETFVVHIPDDNKMAEQLMEKFAFTTYTADYSTPESPVVAKIFVPRVDGELALQLCQYIGEYKNELFMAHYWIRWNEAGAYEVLDIGFERVEEYDLFWMHLEEERQGDSI